MTLHIDAKGDLTLTTHQACTTCLNCTEETDMHISNLGKQIEDTLALIFLEEFTTLVPYFSQQA